MFAQWSGLMPFNVIHGCSVLKHLLKPSSAEMAHFHDTTMFPGEILPEKLKLDRLNDGARV